MSKHIVQRVCALTLFAGLTVAAISGCGRARPPLVPAIDATAELAAAESLLRVGCLDCLLDAFDRFVRVAALTGSQPAAVPGRDAAAGMVRAALLLELRHRELGLPPADDYRQRAEAVLSARPDLREQLELSVAAVVAQPPGVPVDPVADAPARAQRRAADARVKAALVTWREHADADVLSAYTYVAYVCRTGARPDRAPERVLQPLVSHRTAPIVRYRAAACGPADADALRALQVDEPRYVEAELWLGQAAVGVLDLEGAEDHFQRAYTWRREWPALTAALGTVYMAFEEPERALTYFDETLAVAPIHAEARIGRIRALSYLLRHDEAFAAIDDLLNAPERMFPGEALYWRAWNHFRLEAVEPAWAAVEEAWSLWNNSEVAKLAGFVAYRRGELEVARARFSESRRLNPLDCEVIYNIGSILAEQRLWQDSVATLRDTATCLESARARLVNEIASIRQLDTTEERRARQLARREEQHAVAGRMLAAAWFNSAVAHFNLAEREEARRFAQKVVEDERFGERARAIVERLDAAP